MHNILAEKRAISMDTAVCAREKDKPAILAASSRFKGFGTEPLHETRTRKMEANPVIEKMKRAWATCDDGHLDHGSIAGALNKIKIPRYSAKDIETFSLAIAEFQDEVKFSDKAGLFLSALINNCRDEKFVIHTTHLVQPINSFGYQNRKNITVDGNIGTSVGYDMEVGVITVNGNAGFGVGCGMRGGRIIVQGDCGYNVGINMSGGEIHIEGSYEISRSIVSGKIFHNGNLIVPK
jgi:hypothetical protein